MALSAVWTIRCDGCYRGHFDGSSPVRKTTEALARRDGWKSVRKGANHRKEWRCPRCLLIGQAEAERGADDAALRWFAAAREEQDDYRWPFDQLEFASIERLVRCGWLEKRADGCRITMAGVYEDERRRLAKSDCRICRRRVDPNDGNAGFDTSGAVCGSCCGAHGQPAPCPRCR
jgi:hypothetical protein